MHRENKYTKMLTNKYEYDNSYKYEPKRTRNKNEEACPMTEEKKTNTYKKPEVEVIKLDKAASFMTQSYIEGSGEGMIEGPEN